MAAVVSGRGEERWIKHYSSGHNILLVGDGDFSFSLCLAKAFGSAINIVATSLDSYDEVILKYKNARVNLEILKYLGAYVLHGVDATKMMYYADLQWRKFHRIIFNFPHAGFYGKEDSPDVITMHRNLVHGFFKNASTMLWPDGEIHVNHKITAPFSYWKIEELASDCALIMTEQHAFRAKDYPGYNNKRGSCSRCDEPFPLGECRTFKFKLCPSTYQILAMVREFGSMRMVSQNPQTPAQMQQQQPVPSIHGSNDVIHLPNEQMPHASDTLNECVTIFGWYLNHVEDTFGSTNYDDVYGSVHEALRVGFKMYSQAYPGRPLSGYIAILDQLHHLSTLRSQRLREMQSLLDQQV